MTSITTTTQAGEGLFPRVTNSDGVGPIIMDGPDGLPRVLDVALAERLGYERPRDIRQLIKRNLEALEALAGLHELAQTSGAKGGRPATVYYLTHEQAIFLTAKSETRRAASELVFISQVFTEYQQGGLAATDADTQARLDAAEAARQARIAEMREDKAIRRDALRMIGRGRSSSPRKAGTGNARKG